MPEKDTTGDHVKLVVRFAPFTNSTFEQAFHTICGKARLPSSRRIYSPSNVIPKHQYKFRLIHTCPSNIDISVMLKLEEKLKK